MNDSSNRRNAFTLLEMLGVVAILAILAIYIIPRVTTSSSEARNSVNEYNKASINSAVERYGATRGELPNTIDDLDAPEFFPDGIPNNPVDNQPYELDPVTKRVVEGGGGK